MKILTLAALAAGFMCATAAVAAPLPSGSTGIGQATSGDIVQVKMKKKKKKMMMNQGDMGTPGKGAGTEMKGGTNSPVQGGGR